jgi:hypothetical protein
MSFKTALSVAGFVSWWLIVDRLQPGNPPSGGRRGSYSVRRVLFAGHTQARYTCPQRTCRLKNEGAPRKR